jgi:hypothetical protein
VKTKIEASCKTHHLANCEESAGDAIFCQLLNRSHPDLASQHCGAAASVTSAQQAAPVEKATANTTAPVSAQPPVLKGSFAALKAKITSSSDFEHQAQGLSTMMGCNFVKKEGNCATYVKEAAFCLAFADRLTQFQTMQGYQEEEKYCTTIDQQLPALSMVQKATRPILLQVASHQAPEDELAKEMTHDLEMNFNKIAPFGKEDTAKELQDHAAKTQDTLVDAVENAEVAEIKRAVFRALTRLRAATIKEFDTIARLETQAIDAYNDAHHYRAENPLTHLHEDEAPVETDKLKSFH